MKDFRQKPNLDRPERYEIRVPGHLNERWTEWNEGMDLAFVHGEDELPITILTGTLDQAALQGVLRRLYSLGLPLISITCLDSGLPNTQPAASRE